MFTALMAALPWAAPVAQDPPPPFAESDYTRVRDHVVGTESDRAWRTVRWRTSFGAAVLEADAADKPVFLWTMNGHPLGCT